MKRLWTAAALLIALLGFTLFHSFYLSRFSNELTTILHEAEAKAESGHWEHAQDLTNTAWNKWHSHDAYLHVLLRHSETDEIYIGFREVAEFIQCEEAGEYSAANARLIAQLELLSEAEQLTLKNIL